MTFDCPKCGAPVSYESANNPLGNANTVRCGYCSSSLMVPDELQGRPAKIISQVHVSLGTPSVTAGSLKWLWLILLIPLFGVVIGVLAMVGALVPLVRMFSSTSQSAAPANSKRSPTLGGKTSSAFATEVLRFGSEGIGPG